MSRPVAILVAGDPVPAVRERRGGFDVLMRDVCAGYSAEAFVTVDARGGAGTLPSLDDVAGAVVTGSPASVTERSPWMLDAEEFLRSAVQRGTPVLGVCFGHQLLAQALGGRVAQNPRGREIGTVEVDALVDDPLVGARRRFHANMTHVDSVLELPAGARLLARSALDPHAAAQFGARAWGVQFHPELDAELVRLYVEARREQIAGEGLDAAALSRAARDAPEASAVLVRFMALALSTAAR